MIHSLLLIFTLLIGFSSSSAKALVYINHGPAFISNGDVFGGFTQDAIIGLYAHWNLQNTTANAALQAVLQTQAMIQPELLTTKLSPTQPDSKNLLAFGYRDEAHNYQDWSFVETQYGYCHGMTMVNRAFLYLAKFEPSIAAPYDFKKEPKRWLTYYKGLVDSVMSGRVTVIPGFDGLTSFSKSAIAEYLQRHVVDQWGIHTSKLSMLKNAYSKRFHRLSTQEDLDEYREKIARFLARGFYPRAVLGKPNFSNNDGHVVMITQLDPAIANDSKCISFNYWNVGVNHGAYMSSATYCVGDYMYLPPDDFLYYLDFARANSL